MRFSQFPLLQNKDFERKGLLILKFPRTVRHARPMSEARKGKAGKARKREKKTRDAGDRLGGFSALLLLVPHLCVQRSANVPSPSASDTKAPCSSHVLETVGQKRSSPEEGGSGKGPTGDQRAGEQIPGCAPVDIAPS